MVKKRKTILIVDDEEAVRNLLQRTLQDVGYDVITAANGQEALDKVPQFNVSLVLLDIMMPGLDGFQVLDLIRQQSSVPVIMLTGRGEVTTLRDALVLGADDYVRKPFRTRELLARIEAKLRRTET
jgi:OmpR family response regulator RpaB